MAIISVRHTKWWSVAKDNGVWSHSTVLTYFTKFLIKGLTKMYQQLVTYHALSFGNEKDFPGHMNRLFVQLMALQAVPPHLACCLEAILYNAAAWWHQLTSVSRVTPDPACTVCVAVTTFANTIIIPAETINQSSNVQIHDVHPGIRLQQVTAVQQDLAWTLSTLSPAK